MKAVHANSRESYHEFKERTSRYRLVLSVYQGSSLPLTDRQVMNALNMHDMNGVRPRITKLIDDGFIKETGRIRDTLTGKPARICIAIEPCTESVQMELGLVVKL